MTLQIQPQSKRVFIGRFECGYDLLAALTGFCKKNDIKLGTFNVIGAVKKAKLGYYNQEEKKYTYCIDLEKKMEIAACMGNISQKDGEIMVHAHIVLSDLGGKTVGGHLLPDTEIFAAEFHIQEYTGAELNRIKDSVTGLPLWGNNKYKE
ncbi:MAG: DNA-binding protein [Candidatus Margulisbacteria bacterium]|nr:DNA-binding protein [Candidatus Margulisiibacteriota bacterium]MBU1022353.1 DNA-binding protein [Candidatus Margulisiibacteriota bacterium]MBU1729095.1 DNA-binding protein [Candidatus Margulisiibacteriota bacterium]MBU1954484.1 DNA-binding protein [Candidatus Margulisiibacteriota bacterium]